MKLLLLILGCVLATSVSQDVSHAEVLNSQEQHVKDVLHAEAPKNLEQHLIPHDQDQRRQNVSDHVQVSKDQEKHGPGAPHGQVSNSPEQDVQAAPQANPTVEVEVVRESSERAFSSFEGQNELNFRTCKESQTVNCRNVCKTKDFSPLYFCQVSTSTGPYKQTVNCKCSLFDPNNEEKTTTEATTTETTTTDATTTTVETTTETTTPTTTEQTTTVAAFVLRTGLNGTSEGNATNGNVTFSKLPTSKTTKAKKPKGKTSAKHSLKKSAASKVAKKKLTSTAASKKKSSLKLPLKSVKSQKVTKKTPKSTKRVTKAHKVQKTPLKPKTKALKVHKATPKPTKKTTKQLKTKKAQPKPFKASIDECLSVIGDKLCRPLCTGKKFSPYINCMVGKIPCSCNKYDPKKTPSPFKAELTLKKLKSDTVCNCGENSVDSIFPWAVNIQIAQRKVALCSGVLISPTAVITTASCLQSSFLKSAPVQNIRVMLDDKNPLISDGEISAKVSGSKIHPLYNKTNHQNNVAILTLESPVSLTQKIIPICLVPPTLIPQDQFIGVNVTAFGWADSQAKWSEASRIYSAVVQTEACTSGFSVNPNKLDDYICAKTSSKDTCVMGDGAVLSTVVRRKIRLIGIGSFTSESKRDCSKKGVFFKTTKVNDWILQNTDALPCSN